MSDTPPAEGGLEENSGSCYDSEPLAVRLALQGPEFVQRRCWLL